MKTRHAALLAMILSALFTARMSSQTPSPELKFEVASVKRVVLTNMSGIQVSPGMAQPGGRWVASNVTLRQIMRSAYPEYSRPAQIAGGPDWIDRDLFEITAQASGAPPRNQLLVMVQNLLAERFKLVVHTEQRPFDVYVLTLARPDRRLGPGLKPAAIDCAAARSGRGSEADVASCRQRPESGPNDTIRLHAPSFPINGGLTALIAGSVDRPIVDRTGLSGAFDIDLEYLFSPTAGAAGAAGNDVRSASGIYTALQEQLGLKLEPGREPLPVLVIDQVELPTPN